MATHLSLKARLQRKLPRVLKYCRQRASRLSSRERVNPRAVFVLGAQRSGTRLPLLVMERSPDIATYSEGSDPFFDGVMLKSDDVIARELRRMPFPLVVMKPICESHRGVDLLSAFPEAKAVWIYRDYRDTVNSAVAKWNTGVRHLRSLATRDFAAAGWRTGGLTDEKLRLVQTLYRDDMSLHAANAVMWYLRTALFFDIGLDRRDDVLLVKYEDLVRNPQEQFPQLFSFLGCRFERQYLAGVHASSVRSQPFPPIADKISQLCERLMERMDAHYAAQHEFERVPAGR